MSKKINAYGPLGFSPYSTRTSNVDRSALKSARVEKSAAARPSRGVSEHGSSRSGDTGELTMAEQRMILREFPEDPDLSLRLYGPNRDAQTINPGAVGNQLDVQG